METNQDKFVGFLKRNLINFILVLVTFAYLFLDFFNLEITADFTWYKLLGLFTINFGFGYAITDLLAGMGLQAGQNAPKYIATLKEYGLQKEKTDSFSEYADAFCDRYNVKNRERVLKEYYLSYNLKYELVKENSYDLTNLTKQQVKAIRKQNKRVKILNITPKYLFSLSNQPYRNPKKTVDIPTHIMKREMSKIAGKIVFGLAFSMLVFNWVTNPSWANFLSSLIKVATWLIVGAISYFQEYQFVTQDYLQNTVIDKIDLLVQFINEYNKGEFNSAFNPKPEITEEKGNE
jgi:hypothetical protein